MVVKKNVERKPTLLLLLVLALGFFFVTYNFVTIVMHYGNGTFRDGDSLKDAYHGGDDPVIGRSMKLSLASKSPGKFHVAVTASDAPYNQWQCRVMYYWYKRFKDGRGSDMGGFTRVLHSGKEDNLMKEIPSFVVDPLPHDLHKGYVVLNRPWAIVQWLSKATIEEEFIFMGEPDHILVKPLPNLAHADYPAAFPFFYINPTKNERLVRKFYPEEKGPVTNVDPIGNSPAIIKKSLLKEIAPTWLNISLRIKNDKETDETFGWAQEMYGYAIASALHGVKHILRKDFMIQPPWDLEIGKKFILHFTYGCDYNMKGEATPGKFGEWRFDKREYLSGPPPKNLSLPPLGVPESVVTLVKMINEASANIPGWETL